MLKTNIYYNFYGGLLHVFYAPEFESIEDVREKLNERRLIVDQKCKKYESMGFGTIKYDLMSKKFANKLHPVKKQVTKKKAIKSVNEEAANKEGLLINEPKLPDNWVKDTITGNQSYDETVQTIRLKLKSTIVRL